MSLELAIKDHAAALLELAAAIRAAGSVSSAALTAAGAAVNKTETKADPKPVDKKEEDSREEEQAAVKVYWAQNIKGTFGVVDSEAEYLALKKKDAKVVKLTEAGYEKKVKAAAEAEAAAAEEKKGSSSKAAKLTKKDVADAFGAFLPKDLDEAERDERRAFAKEILDRFGGEKLTEMPEEHFALAINMVQRKMAGQDFDVADAEFEEIDEDSMI
jgi:hypothetical protein